ncbi:zinc finger protein 236 [Contarinia nasturtii]|uniref:zinc finger protein 236 n=1 Tax=Contarinia nasturtii TaxID=265458 RepID=UPI0012D3F35F|nr:zinc finger protein 236 [Contarinia nasturtii]
MPSFCAVSSCELKYSHSENVSFHKYPLKNPKVLAKWIQFTNRGSSWMPSRWNSICSRHFQSSCFREYLSRKCLKKEAIPTILPEKSNISYETYHISSDSPDETRTVQSEHDEYGVSGGTFDDSKAASDAIELCRLCGDRADNLTCNPLRSLEDPSIILMCQKCLPSLNTYSFADQSRTICTDCVAQLKQCSEFIDKVLSYQRDLSENIDNNTVAEKNSRIDGNRINSGIKSSTPILFIKQEPINVKQENVESSSRRPYTVQVPNVSPTLCPNPFAESNKIKGVVQQEDISMPKSEFNSTYCQECDRIFVNNHEFRSHECLSVDHSTDRDREQGNNCEIMEVITLNNPISFIDLAEDENATNIELRKPKPEGNFDDRERLEFEHAYAKRATNTSCNLKQEIIDSYNETSQNGYDYNDYDENHGAYFEANVNIFECIKCNQSFVSQQLLDEHTVKLHPLKHKICTICSAEFKSSYDYLIHKRKVHTRFYQCKQCKHKFHTQSALRFHERLCTCESKDFCFSCRHCGKSQSNLAVMKKHLTNCTGKQSELLHDQQQQQQAKKEPYTDQKHECSERGLSWQKSLVHKDPRNANETSEIAENADIQTDLIDVQPIVLNIGGSDDSALKQSFKFIIDDNKFIFLNDTKLAPSNDNQKSSLNGKFACDTCGLPFGSFIELRQHKAEHDSERKFNCSLCPKTFKGISGLKQHISGYHYKIKPFSCPVCGHEYALKGDMQRCRHSRLKNQNSFKIIQNSID